jgi:hypothetical protein
MVLISLQNVKSNGATRPELSAARNVPENTARPQNCTDTFLGVAIYVLFVEKVWNDPNGSPRQYSEDSAEPEPQAAPKTLRRLNRTRATTFAEDSTKTRQNPRTQAKPETQRRLKHLHGAQIHVFNSPTNVIGQVRRCQA